MTVQEALVSVPFRGLFYLNKVCKYCKEEIDAKVSVPFRGLFYLNGEKTMLEIIRKSVSVPFRGLFYLNYNEEDSM